MHLPIHFVYSSGSAKDKTAAILLGKYAKVSQPITIKKAASIRKDIQSGTVA